jgi:hypothetical protein
MQPNAVAQSSAGSPPAPTTYVRQGSSSYKYKKQPGECPPFSGNLDGKQPLGVIAGSSFFAKCPVTLAAGQVLQFGFDGFAGARAGGPVLVTLVAGSSKSQTVLASTTTAASYAVPANGAGTYYLLEGCSGTASCGGKSAYSINTPVTPSGAAVPAAQLLQAQTALGALTEQSQPQPQTPIVAPQGNAVASLEGSVPVSYFADYTAYGVQIKAYNGQGLGNLSATAATTPSSPTSRSAGCACPSSTRTS